MFIPYGQQSISEDEINILKKVLKSGWLTQGKEVSLFENEFSKYINSKFSTATSSGTTALHTAYSSLGVKKNTEVITTSFTFLATVNPVIHLGGEVTFTDIDPSLNLSISSFEALLDKNYIKREGMYPLSKKRKNELTLLSVVHFAGLPVDMERIKKICDSWNINIVEDAAHALGSEYKCGYKVGSCKYSQATTFSFHPVKLITTGEGGMITTNSEILLEKHKIYRHHGIVKKNLKNKNLWYYEQQVLGHNFRLSDIHSAIGRVQLLKCSLFLKKRKDLANIYLKEFKDNDKITLPVNSKGHSWHIFVIRVPNRIRDKLFSELREKEIGVQVHYQPVHLHPYYQRRYKNIDLPKTKKLWKEIITLPLYPNLTEDNQYRVIESIKKILKRI